MCGFRKYPYPTTEGILYRTPSSSDIHFSEDALTPLSLEIPENAEHPLYPIEIIFSKANNKQEAMYQYSGM